ncbi:MAG: carbohydrate binding family 9 domain-containing protein [Myxococcales bacterium]|nr:carbohydrate binding family 9 domain-containing protein [Myxococcales bacterium]
MSAASTAAGALGAALLWPLAAHAGPPEVRAALAKQAPVLDGKLDEPAWQDAAEADGFVERRPHLRASPPVATRFRVLYDAEALYFGVRCDDPEPPRAHTRLRDSFAIFEDDAVTVKLDPSHDERTTLGFAVNPLGARLDYRAVNEGGFDRAFDAVWQAAAARTTHGWSAELRIPWAALGIDPHEPPAYLGLDVSRDHAGRNATYDWVLLPPPFGPTAASLYGHLVGFEGVRALELGSNLRVTATPYVVGGYRSDGDGDTSLWSGGADLLAELGARWTAQLTLNTDFAQVDLDDQVVNLGRFDLYLPEKRAFFQRDAELYEFGRTQSLQAFYSRTIGLSDAGTAIPIVGGLKVLGRPDDAVRVGVMHIVTRRTDDAPWTSHLAARGQLELGRGSNAGLITTYRQSLEDEADHNAVVGLDGAWRGDGSPFVVDSFAMLSATGAHAPSLGAAHADRLAPAAGISVGYRDELVYPRVSYAYVHPDFRADTGFVERTDVQRAGAAVEVVPRIGAAGLEKLVVGAEGEIVAAATDDRVLDGGVAGWAVLQWNHGFAVGLVGSWQSEDVEESFTVGRETEIAAGVYRGAQARAFFETPVTYWLSGGVEAFRRTYYGGLLAGAIGWLAARPVSLVRLEASVEYGRALFDGPPDFSSLLVNSRLSLGFTTDLGVDFYAGYNLLGELVRWQSRLRWSYLEGADFFLVQQLDIDDRTARLAGSSLAVKSSFRLF